MNGLIGLGAGLSVAWVVCGLVGLAQAITRKKGAVPPFDTGVILFLLGPLTVWRELRLGFGFRVKGYRRVD